MNGHGKLALATVAAFALAVGSAACDLDVTNPNEPDRERALAAPDDVEGLIGSTYAQYWMPLHWPINPADQPGEPSIGGLGMAMEVAADHNTASWGNWAMRDSGEEPRKAFPNITAYTYAYTVEGHWTHPYNAITAASDGLRAIDAGLEIGPGGERNPRAIAFAKFAQGLGYGVLAMSFDRAFLIDEATDPENIPDPVPYDQVIEFGLQKLQEALDVTNANAFTTELSWINGRELTSAEFARLIRSYMARFRANVARNPGERDGVNWAQVIADADAGITEDFFIQGESGYTGTPWVSVIKTFGGSQPGWNRVDLAFIGQADVSGAYQNWVASPSTDRVPFNVITPDLRLPQSPGTEGDRGLYQTWVGSTLLPPDRGTYHLSNYLDHRWETYVNSCDECWTGPIMEMLVTEMRLLKAEGLIRSGGDLQQAADLINVTRVANGGLPAVTPAGTSGANCVPRKRFVPTNECGDLLDAMQWEHYIEILQVSGGLTYFFTRGQGELQVGTPIHYPIPARDLEVLERQIYTFGGDAGGAAPPVAPSIIPGDLESAMARVRYANAVLGAQMNKTGAGGRRQGFH